MHNHNAWLGSMMSIGLLFSANLSASNACKQGDTSGCATITNSAGAYALGDSYYRCDQDHTFAVREILGGSAFETRNSVPLKVVGLPLPSNEIKIRSNGGAKFTLSFVKTGASKDIEMLAKPALGNAVHWLQGADGDADYFVYLLDESSGTQGHPGSDQIVKHYLLEYFAKNMKSEEPVEGDTFRQRSVGFKCPEIHPKQTSSGDGYEPKK